MLVLDIDADFMLSTNACDLEAHDGKDDTHIQISAKRIAEVVGSLIGPRTRLIPVVDHHESLYVWDVMRVKDAECIHIDAHHDCWGQYFSMSRGCRGDRTIGCGNYLVQALLDGVVRHVTYVPALWRHTEEEREDVSYEVSDLVSPKRVVVEPWRRFIHEIGARQEKASIVTIAVSPEWFPKRFAFAFKDLCKRLKIKQELVDQILARANKKWKYIKERGLVPGNSIDEHDFTFPYDSRRSLRGKRLIELVGNIRKRSQVRG